MGQAAITDWEIERKKRLQKIFSKVFSNPILLSFCWPISFSPHRCQRRHHRCRRRRHRRRCRCRRRRQPNHIPPFSLSGSEHDFGTSILNQKGIERRWRRRRWNAFRILKNFFWGRQNFFSWCRFSSWQCRWNVRAFIYKLLKIIFEAASVRFCRIGTKSG